MLELLEQLNPQFERVFRERVAMTELTRLSLQASDKEALVVTNKAVYHLKKKFLGFGCLRAPLEGLQEVSRVDNYLQIVQKQGPELRVFFSPSKQELLPRLIKHLKALIN
ncbi:hypothetical protein [Calderihabitans maritimus]|uniref:YokE-like PH domain-containing protein n=1 Tax=Calderihabitans maritimus TaxID=1246530 RepID=A0A1Z5HNR5_9FIRM|nr:hypothetical protein [Calderihabitans maritimus]GAW91163.1 hypothetical protein Nther_1961 [Calderihabitans maritimus]